MKFLLNIIIRFIVITALLLVIALTSRMHVFLAIPVTVIAFFVYAILMVFLDGWI